MVDPIRAVPVSSHVRRLKGEKNMLKEKREGAELGIKTFTALDGTQYIVFRTLDGSFHTFAEVEAKQAARECGAAELANTRAMWESLWNPQSRA